MPYPAPGAPLPLCRDGAVAFRCGVGACCGVGALEERAKNKLFDRMEELADDGEQDDDANISDPTAFAIVATREYEKCKLGLPAYCTRWSGSVEKFRTSLKPE